MDKLPIFVLAAFAAIYVVVAVLYRFALRGPLYPSPRLRSMPSTPAILERVTAARRRQVWWGSIGALCGLGLGAILLVGSQSAIADPGWRPAMSLIWLALFGSVVGSVANLVRNGYAFSPRAGVRVAHSSEMTVRSVVGAPAMIISHLGVGLAVVLVIWVTASAYGRSDPDYPYSQFGDIWGMTTAAVLLVVSAHSLGQRVIRLPSSASTPQELAWDTALKGTIVQELFTNPATAAGIAALMAGSNAPIRLITTQVLLMFVVIILAITTHVLLLHSRRSAGVLQLPIAPATDEKVSN